MSKRTDIKRVSSRVPRVPRGARNFIDDIESNVNDIDSELTISSIDELGNSRGFEFKDGEPLGTFKCWVDPITHHTPHTLQAGVK